MVEMTVSLRARKKAATEAALQQSALDLFAKKGYEGTTIEEIVADAQVSRRTFFRYFSSKEEVIFKGAEADFDTVRKLLRERPRGEGDLEAMKNTVIAFADYLKERNAPVLEFVEVVLNSPSLRARSAELQGRWTQAVAQELAARRGEKSIYIKPFLIASIGIAALTVAIQAWKSGTEPDLEVSLRQAFRLVEDGTLPT